VPVPTDATVWFTPLRVNLRYSPSLARVTLTGRLFRRHTEELRHILGVLRQLPAPVEVDLTAVDDVDDAGMAVLTEEIADRGAHSLPPLRIPRPGRWAPGLAAA
jgi:hypothetical protein